MKKSTKPFLDRLALFLLIATLLVSACTSTQNTTAKASPQAITNAIDSSHWVFTANDVVPQSGTSRNLRGDGYTVVLNNNRLVVQLPYFGQAYSGAAAYATKGPLDFTATDVAIDKQQVKENRWELTIKPKDNAEVQSMNFTFFSNGSASVSITMTNRSGLSFNGNVGPAR